MKEEYMVHVWGGAWNSNANPSIEKDLGISQGYYYFDTIDEKKSFLGNFNIPIYKNQGIRILEKYGFMSHKRTVFVGRFRYEDKEFVIHKDFGYEYEEEYAKNMFIDGDLTCDCNRSLLIQEEYGENAIASLDCGNKINLIDYHFEYLD